jgi:hypothetical protein
VITPDQAAEIRKRNNALMAWVDSIRGKNGWASYRPEDKPADVPDVTNAERSALEVFEFCTNPPDKYFLYINREKQTAATWTGDLLGHVSFGRALAWSYSLLTARSCFHCVAVIQHQVARM